MRAHNLRSLKNKLVNIYYLEVNMRINVDKIKQNCLSPEVDGTMVCIMSFSLDVSLN